MSLKKKLIFILVPLILTLIVVKINYNIFQENEEKFHKKIINELNISYNLILNANLATIDDITKR